MTKLNELKRALELAAIRAGRKPKTFAEDVLYRVERRGIDSISDGFGLTENEVVTAKQILSE